MGLLLGLIIPTLIVLTPLIILIWIGRKQKKTNRKVFGLTLFMCFIFGLLVPIGAAFLSARGLAYNFGPDDPKCTSGAATFLFFGYLFNIIGVPIAVMLLVPAKQMFKKQ